MIQYYILQNALKPFMFLLKAHISIGFISFKLHVFNMHVSYVNTFIINYDFYLDHQNNA
jgi:hypothetical protein